MGHLTTRPRGGRVLGRGWARPGLASPRSNPGPGKARLTSLNEWGREGGNAKTLRYMNCEIKSKYSNKESQNNISKDVYQGLKLNTDFFINPNTNAIKFCGMLNIIYSGKNVPYRHKPMCTVSLSGRWEAEFRWPHCWAWPGLPRGGGRSLQAQTVFLSWSRVWSWLSLLICPVLGHGRKAQVRQSSGKEISPNRKAVSEGSPRC